MKLSIVIPAYNEAECLELSINSIYLELQRENILHEIVIINDNSKDNTLEVLNSIKDKISTLKFYTNDGPNGFGNAIRYGLEKYSGDIVAIVMADLSDSPVDIVKFYRKMVNENLDCVFGDRWIKGGIVIDYPFHKRIANRIFNYSVSFAFGLKYRDLTNAFKMYKRETINGIKPILSPHFNLTLEMPLKAIIRGYSYEVIPNSWQNRKYGESKLKLKEMGSRYFFIFLYCLIEKYFSRNDYKKG